jgi:hypothetical protein
MLPTCLAQSGKHVEERRRGFPSVPGAHDPGGASSAADLIGVPHEHEIVDDERHGRCAEDRLLSLALGMLEAQELLAVVKGDLEGPAPGEAFEDKDRGRAPVSTEERLVPALTGGVPHDDDRDGMIREWPYQRAANEKAWVVMVRP